MKGGILVVEHSLCCSQYCPQEGEVVVADPSFAAQASSTITNLCIDNTTNYLRVHNTKMVLSHVTKPSHELTDVPAENYLNPLILKEEPVAAIYLSIEFLQQIKTFLSSDFVQEQ